MIKLKSFAKRYRFFLIMAAKNLCLFVISPELGKEADICLPILLLISSEKVLEAFKLSKLVLKFVKLIVFHTIPPFLIIHFHYKV